MQDFSKIIEEHIRRGQEATGVLATAVVAEYFERNVINYVHRLLAADPHDKDSLQRIALDFQATQKLHDSLTQAVRDGLTAAERIAQQAKGDIR